jgi:hypothetical protein
MSDPSVGEVPVESNRRPSHYESVALSTNRAAASDPEQRSCSVAVMAVPGRSGTPRGARRDSNC